jgi:uncharacterized damage-inducible protein DinB
MSESEEKDTLHRYLRETREALLWKLEGLPEYDVRRPMTPTGTSLLGLVKHCAAGECVYFGRVVRRPFPGEDDLDWGDGGDPELGGSDAYATEAESPGQVAGFYQRACAHADATITELSLDARGDVPWWPEGLRKPMLRTLLIHMIQETARHAGHADVLRESIDGSAGLRKGAGGMPERATAAWKRRYGKLEDIARSVRPGHDEDGS